MTQRKQSEIDDISGIEERPQNRREWSGVVRSLVLPLLIVGTIVGALYYVQRDRGGGSVDSHGFGVVALPTAAQDPSGRSPSTDVGRVAPDFLLQTPDGGQLRFSDLRGKPVLVNFWASWCSECRQELPDIVKMYDERKADGLVVLAVDLQENDGAVKSFAAEFGMTFPIVIDRTGSVASAWRIGGPIQGIPSSYFVDANGVVRARFFGPMDQKTLNENVAKLLQ